MNEQAANSEQKTTVVDKVKQIVGLESKQEVVTESPTEQLTTLYFQRIHIIVNPASGQVGLNLLALNKLLKDLEIEWEMFVTQKGGEAREYAEQAVAAGVDAVVVYGGDGTVLEVATGISGSHIPMVILPGGTGNVLSVELGIPGDQTEAALLLGGAPNAIQVLDMGVLVGAKRSSSTADDILFFHLGIGLEGTIHEEADREAKDRSGMLAYAVAALKTLSNPTMVRYHLTLDGEAVEVEGINCMITSYGSVGVPGITFSHAIDMSDGLLDVIIFQDANISSLLAAGANAVASGELAQSLMQWQAREVTVVADLPQTVVVDGELIDVDKVMVRVLPQAVRVVVPALSGDQGAGSTPK